MASGNEHRMVFDIRGKRRHVVKAVYAVLAILMAASLFLVVGPVNIGNLLGSSSSSSNLAGEYEERAERIERELKKNPGDEELLAKLTKQRNLAAGQLLVEGPTGEIAQTVESRTQYQKASSAWSEYLKVSEEPNANLAQQMAGVLFGLAKVSRSYPEADANVKAAAEAQKIYAEQRPTLNSYSTLGIYEVFAGNSKAAEEANERAEAKASSKFQREQISNQFNQIKKNAVIFRTQVKESEEAAKEASAKGKGGTTNSENLENPLGTGLGGGGGLVE